MEKDVIEIEGLNASLCTIGGLTYPHHLFGSCVVLVEVESGAVLLPGLRGEVYLHQDKRYRAEKVRKLPT
ncbi:unnamed protein product [Phytomonas sp. EM1]|nr:unnamed protein product [Phytomonas sp. EM1]|eukprot:CCW63528.1 unnamed protein product [Phytomonas sp. isolate EM1]